MQRKRSRRPHSTVQSAWDEAKNQGKMYWLEDTTLISADCFEPPRVRSRLRAWDRVAVPTTTSRRSEFKIQKRVNLKALPDKNYTKVTAELECQSLDPRKQARTVKYILACGEALFEDECAPKISGAEELAKAREYVKSALESIWKDNVRLCSDLPPYNKLRDRKRSTYDPANLPWVIPRKRHNSRWPIPPPKTITAMIAPFQPLIKFELHPKEIDDPGFLEQLAKEAQTSPLRLPKPSPGTKVADSRLKEFTLGVTDDKKPAIEPSSQHEDELAISTEAAKIDEPQVETPRSNTTESVTPATATDAAKITDSSSSITTAFIPETWSTYHLSSPTLLQAERTPISAVAIFDQPYPIMQKEPEYESKRRVSLDNARRSDRRSDIKIVQRAWSYICDKSDTNTGTKRRHSDITYNATPPASDPKRRRTFDVDVSKTLDIFGQPAHRVDPRIPAPLDTSWRESFDRRLGARKKEAQQDKTSRRLNTVKTRSVASADENLSSAQEETMSTFQGEDGVEAEAALLTKVLALNEDKDDTSTSPEDPADPIPAVEMEGDSELDFLHNFVQRAKTSKGRRDMQSSMTTKQDTSSPTIKSEDSNQIASMRVPLGTKDSNKSPSPSPSTKRKLQRIEAAQDLSPVPAKKTRSRLAIPDFEDNEAPPRVRRRRRGAESDTDDILNPEMGIGQDLTQRRLGAKAETGVIRRSSRIAESKVGEALRGSTIPISIRMPGSFVLDDIDMPAVSTVGVNARKNEKERDQETKKNTKKNSNGALSVPETLAKLQQEKEANAGEDAEPLEIRSTQPGRRTVQWARVLKHIQFSDGRLGIEPDTESADDEEEEDTTKTVSVDGEDTRLPTPPRLRSMAFAGQDSIDQPDTILVRQYGDMDDEKTDSGTEGESEQPTATTEDNKGPEITQRKILGTPRATKVQHAHSRRSLRSGSGISRLPTLASGGMLASSGSITSTSTTNIPSPLQFTGGRMQGGTPSKLAPIGRLTRAGAPMLAMAGPGTPRPRRRGGFPR